MKHTLTLIITAYSFVCYSQKYLGKSILDAKYNLVLDANVYDIEIKKYDSLYNTILYRRKDIKFAYCFALSFDDNDICDAEYIQVKNSEINMIVSDFNKKFVRISEFQWVDYTRSFSLLPVYITIDMDKGDNYFTIRYALNKNTNP